jgi:hypothetical protein
LRVTTAFLTRIATAVSEHDVDDSFVIFASQMLAGPLLRTVFRRLVSRADITHRHSFLDPQKGSGQFSSHDVHEIHRPRSFSNMSLARVMFVLQRMMLQARSGQRGCAVSFGAELTAETMRFHGV